LERRLGPDPSRAATFAISTTKNAIKIAGTGKDIKAVEEMLHALCGEDLQ